MAFDPFAPGAVMHLDRDGRAYGRRIGALAVRLASPKSEGGKGLTMSEAIDAAIAKVTELAATSAAWSRALEEWPGTPAKRVVDSLVESEAVARWRWSLGALRTEEERRDCPVGGRERAGRRSAGRADRRATGTVALCGASRPAMRPSDPHVGGGSRRPAR
jgi:hypothetical protein